ncbi:MAG TPA: GH3 auxin-responsive promoter family protein, partial [Brumimicrobium sp.]|nr:GH3 auxin-responsive promoter family protein [Brumimicrobium sp.]
MPSRETALMSKWEEKIERLAIETMDEDVSSISGVPSWTLVLLNRILEIKGKKDIREIWPNLELLMHGGVSFKPYENEFKKIIPHENMHYVESYNASEGFFSIQDQIVGDLLLMLDYGVFFEFIPMVEFDGVYSKNTISLKDVQPGVNYGLVISTNGGLWRYIIGDTVKFTEINPYR